LDEFELKIKGADYLEILAAGGGILSTVKKTREASCEELVELGQNRLDKMLACGTTTAEIKTGYGLDTENELKMLRVIEELDKTHSITIVPTFLAAHAVPPEFKENSNGYVDLVTRTMLPAAWRWFAASRFHGHVPHFANARKLIDAGGAIALSTDNNPGSAPCPSQPMAMAISCRYQKLFPEESFNAATINAAFAIGLGNQFGSIEVGKTADLLVLDSSDYREIAYEFGGNMIKS